MQPDISEKIDHFFALGTVKHYAKNEVIIQADQPPAGILYLVDGIVEQYATTTSGNKVIVNVFKPPAFFPMSWAINDTANEYSFTALTDIHARLMPRQDTIQFLKDNPDVLYNLLSRVYRGTDALLRRLVVASSGVASNRLVVELIIEAYRFGEKLDESRYLIKPQQQTLASRSGLARETVSRELSKLEEAALVQRSARGIILDPKKLEQLLDIQF